MGTRLTPRNFCVVEGSSEQTACAQIEGAVLPAVLTEGPHVFVGRRKGMQISVRVDGAERATFELAERVDATASQPATIGQSLALDLSEVIVIVGSTPDDDLARLEQHLMAKYQLD